MTKRTLLRIIFVQALLATLGSLYYSYFGDPITNLISGELFVFANGLSPCDLCRWARILMYPLVVIAGVALREKKYSAVVPFILPFSLIGIGLETYHYLLQKVNISTSFTCTFANPCNALEVNYLGFITIPFLCLTAFVVITVCCVCIMKKVHK